MAILSEYEEEDQKKPTSSATSSRKQFNASLDPSDPLGFLEKVFEFVARESDLFKSDSLVKDVNAVVRMVKDKVETEDNKRKEVKIEGNGKAEKKIKIKEEVAPSPVKKAELKNEKVKEEKESGSEVEEKNGRRGNFLFQILVQFFLFFYLETLIHKYAFLFCFFYIILQVAFY